MNNNRILELQNFSYGENGIKPKRENIFYPLKQNNLYDCINKTDQYSEHKKTENFNI